MSRSADAIQNEALELLPDGWVLPRDPDTYFAGRLRPMAEEWALIEAEIEAMLAEVDPRAAAKLIGDYKRVLGPDPCGRDLLPLSSGDQRAVVYQRWTMGGPVCAGLLIRLAAAVGIAMTVTEYPMAECGAVVAGDALVPFGEHLAFLCGLPINRVWDAISGEAQAGDALGGFTPSLMECVVRLLAPVWTTPVFSYS